MMRAFDLKKFAIAKLLVVLFVFSSTVASATVMLYVDLARLVELSDVVVQGRVVDQSTHPDDALGNVVTVTTIEITKNFYGAQNETIKVTQWGGEFDGKIARVPGDASFEPYENVILFLNAGKTTKENGKYFLTALAQSKYTVHNDQGSVFAIRNLDGLAFMNPVDNTFESKSSEVTEYKTFVGKLKVLIETAKGGER